MKLPLLKNQKIPGMGYVFVRERNIDKLHTFSNHRRLQVFFHKGTQCVTPGCCNIGTRLIFSQDSQGGGHWDLYTDDLLLMTVDHITPKKLGGADDIANYQPMCRVCNTRKGHQDISLEELAVQVKEKSSEPTKSERARLRFMAQHQSTQQKDVIAESIAA